jgi:4-hydroxybenzoate polyprenyltransferase/tetratricopeptide (TPR) repeat protein
LAGSPSTPKGSPRGPMRFCAQLEQVCGADWRWLALLAAWILARNLAEGVLERPHVLGFDWRPEVSAPMVFLHFPLFYLGVFFAAALWLHLLTRRALPAVAGVVAAGFALLLVAPVVDALATGGRGYDLAYLPGIGSTLQRFWDPSAALSEVSPGQRVEIGLACLLAAAYAGLAIAGGTHGRVHAGAQPSGRRDWPRIFGGGLLAGAGLFLGFAALGAWPAWFARLASVAGDPAAGGPAAAYQEVFRGFGLLADESRRHAVALALPILPLGLAFCWRLDPRRWHGYAGSMSWPRFTYYTGLVPAGAFLGWWLYKDQLPSAFHNPTDWAALAVLWAAMAAAYHAALLWNDRHDREGDAINDPGRPLVTGLLDPGRARAFAWVCAALAAWLALAVGYHAFLLMLACLLLAHLYSTPPLRLKRWPLVATLALGVLSLLSMGAGFSLFGQEMTPLVFPRRIAVLIVLGVMLGFTAKDLKDVRGDAATGVSTFATLLGEARARRLTATFVLGGYALAALLLPLGWSYWVAATAFGLGSALVVLRRRRPDDLLLIGFLVFVVVSAVLLARQPVSVLEGGAAGGPWSDLHGELRWIEEGVRCQRSAHEGLASAGGADANGQRLAERVTLSLARVGAAGGTGQPPGGGHLLQQRLLWARAQVSPEPRAGEDLRALAREEPLNAAYRERLAVAAEEGCGSRAAGEVCSEALAVGLRPGDFLRHRAAATLAALRLEDPERAAITGAPAPARGAGARSDQARADRMAAVEGDLVGAWRLGQERPALAVLAGDLAVVQGRPEAAARRYRGALRADENLADAWSGLGEALFESSDLPGSIAAFERAANLRPGDAWILNNFGVALREAGQAREAVAPLLRAARLAPGLFEPAFNLGLTYTLLGEWGAAASWLGQARALRPGFPPVEEALHRLDRPMPRR